MSFITNFHVLLNEATSAAVDAGFAVISASGNNQDDACLYSPASAVGVISVGSSNKVDEASSFSNHGACVDV